MISKRGVLVLLLHRCEGDMMIMFRCQLMGVWSRVETTFSAVETHSSYVDVIYHRLVVHVGHMHAAKVGD